MIPFREAMHRRIAWLGVRESEAAIRAFLTDRDERFTPGNDKVWGEGGWVRCERPSCLDSLGYPAYHSTAYHD